MVSTAVQHRQQLLTGEPQSEQIALANNSLATNTLRDDVIVTESRGDLLHEARNTTSTDPVLNNLQSKLTAALQGNPATLENILVNPEARLAQYQILHHLYHDQSTPPQERSKIAQQTIAILDAELHHALDGRPANFENIIENPIARNIQIKTYMVQLDNGRKGGSLSRDQESFLTDSIRNLLDEDLRISLDGLEPTRERILSNQHARRAQLQICSFEINEFNRYINGPGEMLGYIVPRAELLVRTKELLNVELRESLDGQNATIKNIAQNPRAQELHKLAQYAWNNQCSITDSWGEQVKV